MQHVQGLLFVLILIIGYAVYFRHQDPPKSAQLRPVPVQAQTPAASDPYKASLDRAQAAAKQMQAARQEANSF